MRDKFWVFLIGLLLAAVLASTSSERSLDGQRAEILRRAQAASGDPGGPPQGGVQYGQGYLWDRQSAAFRSGLQTADTLTSAGMLATTPFIVNGRQNITVSARFTNPGQTCTVAVLWIWNTSAIGGANSNNITGISNTLTCTGSSTITDASSRYMAPTINFDGNGASHARIVLVSAPSAGLVDLYAGSE